MFQTALATAAIGTATDANVARVAKFLDFAVSNLGFGVAAVASAGAPTEVGDNVTAWTATFTVNGKAANIVFSAAAATFPAGAKHAQGATQTDGADALTVVGDSNSDPWTSNSVTPTATLWTAVVTIDGSDAGSTLEANERVLTLTRLV
jgi:hypothetical protein